MTIQLKQLSASVVFSAMVGLVHGQTPSVGSSSMAPPDWYTKKYALPVPANWYTQKNFLPAHIDPASINAPIINPQKTTGGSSLDTRCELPNGLVLLPYSGVIMDTSSVYGVILDRNNNACTLQLLLKISPNDPSTAKELVAEIERLVPKFAMSLSGVNPSSGQPAPVFGIQGRGVHLHGAITLSLASRVPKTASATPTERPLTGEWWNDPALLPQKLSRPLSVTARSGANRCTLSNGATVPLNSIVIPDTSHAYFLDQNCRLNPLITLPDAATSAAIASTGGRFPAPARGGLPTTPASAGAIAANPETAAVVVRGLQMLGTAAGVILTGPVGWSVIAGTAFISGAVAYTVWDVKQQSGLTDTQIGQQAIGTQVCKPCAPYPADTIGYIGPHTDHSHGKLQDHLNLFKVNQSRPPSCKCFWNKNSPDAVAPPPQPGWVDLNSGFPTLTP